ncbi:cytochrome b/b6 domain-containing protein [uncultured Cohaesibacter sp.]|uniref:cytochrome b/b6 domain-containing protein n=1 Tax=uncultured Cohaesibacter sp. TaxID=1002546 RepID=UPI0029C94A55|nr:cytochrome b/b6 domain-containing protein [uncultured Cohaesibacter sp.]
MPVLHHMDGGGESSRDIPVWDPLVRLIHWTLVLTIFLNGAILDPEYDWHHWVGYLATGLVVVRLIWGFLGPTHSRFSAFPPNPFAAIRHIRAILKGDNTIHLSHNPLGSLMVYNIWLTILTMGVTGYLMGTLAFFGVEWVKELHEIAFNWLLTSIVLHIGGVIFETRQSGVHLVRAMINGRKRIPPNREIA